MPAPMACVLAGVLTVLTLAAAAGQAHALAFTRTDASPFATGGSNPRVVSIADFDNDGKPDLAVANSGSGNVSVLLGHGTGDFTHAEVSPMWAGGSAYGLAVGDFDENGDPDLAVTNDSTGNVMVLLGNGDGTFAEAVHYEVGAYPETVVAADLNGDGIPDLATSDNLGTLEFDGSVSVLLGNGDGTFADAETFEAGVGPWGMVAADLNGDRLPDLITANFDAEDISLLENTGTPPTPSCVGDCNGDGEVSINELITGVNIALGSAPVSSCEAIDENGNGEVTINELISAVNNALTGCPAA